MSGAGAPVRELPAGHRYLVLVNVGATPANYALAARDARRIGGGATGTAVAGTHPRAAGGGVSLASVALGANEAVVVRVGGR